MSRFERMPSPVQLAFIRGCLASARATSAISKSVIVRTVPCDFPALSLTSFCASSNLLASTSRTKKKCGTVVQLSVVRSAVSRATWPGLSSPGAAARVMEAGTTALESANFCTSSAVIAPSGPVPGTIAKSTPNSFARRRAFGEICGGALATVVFAAAAAWTAARVCCGTPPIERAAGRAAATFTGGCSPGATSHAMVSPTGITAPTSAVIPASIPSPGASTSTTALSVSISSNGSPLRTLSPSFFRHASSLPVSCAISSAGITTLIAIISLLSRPQSVAATPSALALDSTISFTRRLGGCSFSRVVESGPFTV